MLNFPLISLSGSFAVRGNKLPGFNLLKTPNPVRKGLPVVVSSAISSTTPKMGFINVFPVALPFASNCFLEPDVKTSFILSKMSSLTATLSILLTATFL